MWSRSLLEYVVAQGGQRVLILARPFSKDVIPHKTSPNLTFPCDNSQIDGYH
jgi:hypothetical protein